MSAAPPSRWTGADPFTEGRDRFEAGRLGMRLFIVSLVMLFGASVIGFLVIRVRAEAWPDLPPLPPILWLSTALLLASSGTIQWSLHGARGGRQVPLRRGLLLTVALGLCFLALQAVAWWSWREQMGHRLDQDDLYRFALTGFYVLTGVHAAHVIGGLVPMTFVTGRALRGGYGPDRHAGVQYCTTYWHFLDAVWLVLFVTLLVGA